MRNPAALLCWSSEIGRDHPFLDFHTHPFDVLRGEIAYQPGAATAGLFTAGMTCYHAPVLAAEPGLEARPLPAAAQSERGLLLAARLVYAHTGPRVFADQLALVPVAGALLLPVARAPGQAGLLLEAQAEMFGGEPRWVPGCPFPVGAAPDELEPFFRQARTRQGIRVIKVHPNLSNLNPRGAVGGELLEATLAAAGALNLALVLHTGRTPGLEPPEQREFSALSQLAQVDWSLSAAPVIFAHAGCYGLAPSEWPQALHRMARLLEKYPNLMADTSNLAPEALQLVLAKLDPARLLFGSDALYVPVWKAWLQFLAALEQVSASPERDLIQIASTNPLRCLAATGLDFSRATADSAQSASGGLLVEAASTAGSDCRSAGSRPFK